MTVTADRHYVRVLGTVAVGVGADAAPTPFALRLLALLVAAGDDGISSAKCADEIWGDSLPDTWSNSIRNRISELRARLGKPAVVTKAGRYRLALDVNDVDAWRLRALAADPETIAGADEATLLAALHGEPYADLEVSPLIRFAISEVEADRTVLKKELSALRNSGRTFGPKLSRLLDADDAPHVPPQERPPSPSEPSLWLSKALVPLASDELFGRDGEVVEVESLLADQQCGVLISGESGIGKTRLVAELGMRARGRGAHVLYVAGSPTAHGAYAPFLQACPALRTAFRERAGTDHALPSLVWVDAVRVLEQEYSGAPLMIIADDIQWFDTQSMNLLEFLVRADGSRIDVVAAGRHAGSTNWASRFAAAGMKECTLDGLGELAIRAMVAQVHPLASSRLRNDLAKFLFDGGIRSPAHVGQLSRAADPTTLTVDTIDCERPEIWRTDQDPAAGRLAAVATVLGSVFTLESVADLAGETLDSVVDAADHLVERGVWVRTVRAREFRFRHLLVRQAYSEALGKANSRRVHREQFHLSSDPIQRSWHGRRAGALLPDTDVLEATVAAARLHFDAGTYQEAIACFRQATKIATGPLAVADAISYATALECAGGDGRRVRSNAFDLALAHDDAELALRAAMAGQLSAERADGDLRQVRLLERVGQLELNSDDRFRQLTVLGRQYGLLGRHEDALDCVAAAEEMAETPGAKFDAWLAGWPTAMRLDVSRWHPLEVRASELEPGDLRRRRHEIEFLRGLISGDTESARLAHAAGADDAGCRDPVRSWHHTLCRSTLMFLDGSWEGASRVADEAFTFAQRHNLRDAFAARAAQLFAQFWAGNLHGLVVDSLDQSGGEVQGMLLRRSAVVAAQWAAGQDETARNGAIALLDEVTESESPYSPVVATLVAEALDPKTTPRAVDQARSILSLVREGHVVVGGGIAHLGPTVHVLARLARNEAERVTLLEESIASVDAAGLRTWQVAYRVELAATAGPKFLSDAAELAAGSDLTRLVVAASKETAS